MQTTISIPDSLIPTIDAWRQTQITGDGQFFKYADTQDLVQQNINDGLLTFFVGLFEAPQVAALQAQIDALKSSVALTPAKPPVPVVKP
jgi:hypothetical protein